MSLHHHRLQLLLPCPQLQATRQLESAPVTVAQRQEPAANSGQLPIKQAPTPPPPPTSPPPVAPLPSPPSPASDWKVVSSKQRSRSPPTPSPEKLSYTTVFDRSMGQMAFKCKIDDHSACNINFPTLLLMKYHDFTHHGGPIPDI